MKYEIFLLINTQKRKNKYIGMQQVNMKEMKYKLKVS